MGQFAVAVRNGIDNEFIKWAEGFGREISRQVSTSQIRGIFGSIKKMEMAGDLDMPSLLLLKPRIAYAVARSRNLRDLGDELQSAIDAVDKSDDDKQRRARFRRFCQGFEAILAYHRAAGGK